MDTYTRANVVFTVQTHTINIVFPGTNCWYIIHMYLSQGCILCLIIMMLINGQSIPELLVSCLLGFSRRQNLSYVPSWLSAHVVQSFPVWGWLSLVSAAVLIPAYHRCHHCIYATGNSNMWGEILRLFVKARNINKVTFKVIHTFLGLFSGKPQSFYFIVIRAWTICDPRFPAAFTCVW